MDNPGGTSTCSSPYNLGNVLSGASAASPTRVLAGTGTDWYVVNFPASGLNGAPSIVLGRNDANAYVFDIITGGGSGCAGSAMSCGDGGVSTGRTNWQFFDACVAQGCAFRNPGTPFPLITMYIGVRRAVPTATDCNQYLLQVTR